MAQTDENGFVKRGFYLLGGMAALAAVVLSIIFYRPEARVVTEIKDLPAEASEPGWRIRYNAAVALLRRGSDEVPWGVVRDMLDQKQQLKNCEVTRSDGSVVPDDTLAARFVIAGLKALAEWPQKAADAGHKDAVAPRDVIAEVDALTHNPIPDVQKWATNARKAIARD